VIDAREVWMSDLWVVLYAYSRNVRSSRVIERLEDIAYRVIMANERPDHSTIARFVARHEQALAGVFSSVLAVCAKAGLVKVGVVAVDGTKVAASVNEDQTLDYEQITREALAEAKALDEAEDELYGIVGAMSCRQSLRPQRAARPG
jgi:hypothetical protein